MKANKHLKNSQETVLRVSKAANFEEKLTFFQARQVSSGNTLPERSDYGRVENTKEWSTSLYHFKIKEIINHSSDESEIISTSFLSDRKHTDSKGRPEHFKIGQEIAVIDSFSLNSHLDNIKREEAMKRGKRLFTKAEYSNFNENVDLSDEEFILYLSDWDEIHQWYNLIGLWPKK
ncbi:MAG: hypothetical protein AB8E15_07040 [Bdellovibrionales bacterium]